LGSGVQKLDPVSALGIQIPAGLRCVAIPAVLAGRVVSDSDTSERFLWDFRRTLKELLADNHYGVLAQVLHERGMRYYTEAQGDTPRAIGDGMTMKARIGHSDRGVLVPPVRDDAGPTQSQGGLEERHPLPMCTASRLVACEALTVAAGTIRGPSRRRC